MIAKLTGSDPDLKNTYVIYTAHWDHFGIGPEVNGDKIYHGAVDNASGTAALLEMARAYKALPTPPRRTILFLSVTAEEQGLLGSQYYAEHPLYPLARTALDINMDGMNVNGRTHDIVQIGRGVSTLDDVVDAVAPEQGRVVKFDPEPEKGFYYRSDHFEFAKNGVPAFDPDEGVEFIGKPEGWGLEERRKYTAERYHKPADKIQPDWDMGGAVEDSQLYFLVGYRVANRSAHARMETRGGIQSDSGCLPESRRIGSVKALGGRSGSSLILGAFGPNPRLPRGGNFSRIQ